MNWEEVVNDKCNQIQLVSFIDSKPSGASVRVCGISVLNALSVLNEARETVGAQALFNKVNACENWEYVTTGWIYA